jgi:hypothetical protein
MFADAAQARNEVIFKHTDSTFGSIAAMDARGHELEINGLVAHELFQGSRAFIVQTLCLGLEADMTEFGA